MGDDPEDREESVRDDGPSGAPGPDSAAEDTERDSVPTEDAADSGTGSDATADADANTGTDATADAESDTAQNADTDADAGADADADTDTDADAEDTSVATDGAVETAGQYSPEYEVYDGPPEDEEMPLAEHIEEMIRRLMIVLLVAGTVTLVAYPASERLIEFLWQSYIPNAAANRPVVYGPLEFVLTKLQVAALSGLIIGLPVFVYQTYRFMRPGLYPNERRYYLASVPTSLVLALLGVTFAHFVVLPLTFLYFTSYTESAAIVAFGLQETFNLIVLLMAYMAIVFQIPLFIMLAIMMNLVSRQWLENKRLLFWAAFGGLSFTFVAVDPTGMAPIIIALTMIVLFEVTLLLLRWTGN